ncbi:MAG: hypothetical protein A3I54_04945 [Candidatus Levybacteria bacterium RIFCSPLOWO2_02_FULL_41_11]|nr:MAG: hypothetical protein A3I54_04945 [Candidatus Levybacteria bacterium RIFCSPLOWO2_02_FULL_41_11]
MEFIKRFIFPFLLVVLTVFISFLNYTPGTFLTGWDTLHPEFNFAQNFSNIFFGVFRTDQGLGAVAAHAHMAELPRLVLLWLFSFIFPLSFLRYSIIFLCFILGPLGVYFFTKRVLNLYNNLTIEQWSNSIPAFLASLIYIFNLGTVQHFYVPFEMFTIQYAALPWLFLTALRFIEKGTNLALLLFAIVTLLASPIAYASVLWYAYFAFLLLFLITYSVLKRQRKVLLRSLFLVITTLVVNAYWILPNMYFLANGASNVSLAQTNKIFSDEAFLYNKEYGNILDTAILRNFLFSWTQSKDVHTTEDLLSAWKTHLNNPITLTIGYAVFVIVLIGILITLIRKKSIGIAFIPGFLFSLIMVMNMNPPFETLFSFLRETSPIFREALRFPFTKFSILLMFSMSFFFAVCLAQILKAGQKIKPAYLKSVLPLGIALVFSASLAFYGAPMFKGELINRQMRIAIPPYYFELFDYLSKKPQGARVAPLPLQSLWGWEYYNWRYQGAGFIWFGIKQPVLARDFDRWNAPNEQYFREMSTAVYSRDVGQIEALARKYRISYFLLDESVVFPGYKQNALWHYETHDTFKKSRHIKLEKQFGYLYLYKVDEFLTGEGYVQQPQNIISVAPQITGGFVDLATQNHGDYITLEEPDFTYFSRSFVDRYDRVDPANISFLGDKLILRLGKNKGYSLTDSWKSNDIFPEFMRNSYDLSIEEQGNPFIVDDEQFIFFPATSSPVNVSASLEVPENCGGALQSSKSRVIRLTDAVAFIARNGSSCGFITFSSAKQDFGSILIIEARNLKGLPTRLCISENITERCGIYTALDPGTSWKRYVFIIPPLPSGGSGYAVHFNTVGIGNEESENEIRFAQLIQIPYYRIANLSFVKNGYVLKTNGVSIISSLEINPTLYTTLISAKNNEDGLIALFKAFDPGWQAYQVNVKCQMSNVKCSLAMALPFLFGSEIGEHVEVNGWANGWLLNSINDQRSKIKDLIVIVYLPQYLEYAGFAILIITFCVLSGRVLLKRSE